MNEHVFPRFSLEHLENKLRRLETDKDPATIALRAIYYKLNVRHLNITRLI